MGTRQYIGARYVPKFYQNSVDGSANWQSNVVYEPLTYVTLTNGHMYISKKQVPATVGTPASNAEYWLDVGSYNGFIEELQDEIDNLDSEITKLSNKAKKKSLSEQHILIIADSWGDGSDEFPKNIQNYGIFKQVDIKAGGGLGFTGKEGAAGDTGTSLEWLTYFKNYINQHTQEELDDVDAVYICGGFNDHYSTAQVIYNHMQEFFEYAHAHLPVDYYLIETGWTSDYPTITTPNGSFTSVSIRAAIANTVIPCYANCGRYGCTFLGHTVWAMHNYAECYDTGDHYHPTAYGQSLLTKAVLNLMIGGVGSQSMNISQYCYVDGQQRLIQGGRLGYDTITLLGRDSRFRVVPDHNVSAHEDFKAAGSTFSDTTHARYIAARSGGNRNYIPCQAHVNNTDLYTTVFYYADDGSIHLLAPCALTTNDYLSIQPLACTLSLLDC